MILIRGKWYKDIYRGRVLYFIFREKIGNDIYGGTQPNIRDYYILLEGEDVGIHELSYNFRIGIFGGIENLEEVGFEEIIGFLPIGHRYRKDFRKHRLEKLLNISNE